jgi:carboxyl-terminal processing protease
LATALAEIQSPIAKPSTKPKKEISLKLFETSRSFKPFFDEMYVDKKLTSDVLNNFLVE